MYEDIMFQTKDHLVFHWCFFNRERILHGSTEVRNFSSSVEKYFTSEQRKQEKYLSTQDEKCRTSKQP